MIRGFAPRSHLGGQEDWDVLIINGLFHIGCLCVHDESDYQKFFFDLQLVQNV